MSLLSNLAIYTVHIRPTDIGHPDRIRFIREGFCLNAFVFGALWALYHGLWQSVVYLLILNAGLAYLGESGALDPFSMLVAQLAVQTWYGFRAHDELRARYNRKGYVMSALVSGENRMRAEQRFFDRHSHYLAYGRA